MIPDKDPVREQIHDDAIRCCAAHYGIPEDNFDLDDSIYLVAVDNATTQDRIAWNRCLDEVISFLMMTDKSFASPEDYRLIIQELKSKRR